MMPHVHQLYIYILNFLFINLQFVEANKFVHFFYGNPQSNCTIKPFEFFGKASLEDTESIKVYQKNVKYYITQEIIPTLILSPRDSQGLCESIEHKLSNMDSENTWLNLPASVGIVSTIDIREFTDKIGNKVICNNDKTALQVIIINVRVISGTKIMYYKRAKQDTIFELNLSKIEYDSVGIDELKFPTEASFICLKKGTVANLIYGKTLFPMSLNLKERYIT